MISVLDGSEKCLSYSFINVAWWMISSGIVSRCHLDDGWKRTEGMRRRFMIFEEGVY
jgi:hypothetical protein